MQEALAQFLGIMVPVLFANLLTAMFIYGIMRRSKQERDGREDDDAFLTLGSIIMPLGFLVGGLLMLGVYPR